MAVLMSEDKKDIIFTCACHCNNSCRITLDEWDGNTFAYMVYSCASHFREHNNRRRKAKKIWQILKGEDYCYTDLILTKEDWIVFKDWVNAQELPEV